MRQITFRPAFDDWQRAARLCLQQELLPGDLVWQELLADQPALDIFEEANDSRAQAAHVFRVS